MITNKEIVLSHNRIQDIKNNPELVLNYFNNLFYGEDKFNVDIIKENEWWDDNNTIFENTININWNQFLVTNIFVKEWNYFLIEEYIDINKSAKSFLLSSEPTYDHLFVYFYWEDCYVYDFQSVKNYILNNYEELVWKRVLIEKDGLLSSYIPITTKELEDFWVECCYYLINTNH